MKTSISRTIAPLAEIERITEKEKLLEIIKDYYKRLKKLPARIKIKLDSRTWAWVRPGSEGKIRKKYEGKLYGTTVEHPRRGRKRK